MAKAKAKKAKTTARATGGKGAAKTATKAKGRAKASAARAKPARRRERREPKLVHVAPHPLGWEVRKEGNERATAIVQTQEHALEIAERAAAAERSRVVVHAETKKTRAVSRLRAKASPP